MQLKKYFSFLPDLFSPSSPSQLCRQDLPLAFTASILCLCSFATDHKSWFWLRRLTEVSPTEAEIAFAVAPRLDLVDTGPSTGGQDQPRPLHCFHRDDDDNINDDNDDNDDYDVDTHGSPSSTGGQLGPPFTLFSSSS